MTDYIEQEIARVEREVYEGNMPAHNKQVLREKLKKEDKFWERFERDHRNGYDDGEPQTTADFNR